MKYSPGGQGCYLELFHKVLMANYVSVCIPPFSCLIKNATQILANHFLLALYFDESFTSWICVVAVNFIQTYDLTPSETDSRVLASGNTSRSVRPRKVRIPGWKKCLGM